MRERDKGPLVKNVKFGNACFAVAMSGAGLRVLGFGVVVGVLVTTRGNREIGQLTVLITMVRLLRLLQEADFDASFGTSSDQFRRS